MKKTALLLLFLLLCATLILGVSADGGSTVTFDDLTVSEDGYSLKAEITLTESFVSLHDKIYLFRVTADHQGDLSLLTPIAEKTAEDIKTTVTLPYQASDPSNALYGYVLARSDGKGGYLPMSKVVYPSNFADFAQHQQAYPSVTSKKGLQIQLPTDAQLLGVKHTVVNVFFNELISETEKDATAFVYGGSKYYIKTAALAALDYRIRSLTDAGVHVYVNFLLAFDSSAPSELYYPSAEGTGSTLYAPNVSTPEGIRRYASVIHFLASRYTEPEGNNGFCGSYIVGYEVNREGECHSAGIASLSEYASEYAILLRTADTAVRSAYQNGRVYLSLSNQWVIAPDEAKSYRFGAKEFLGEIAALCPDVPFGVSLNPYPSDLSLTDYWNDEKAVNSDDTPYLTLKNLSVLTEYLKTEPFLYNGRPRRALAGEFGLSGKLGESEELQAAAYLYAYYTVCRNTGIEALIWHRHVDHAGEKGLYYGLYASSELLLDPTEAKLIHSVFSAVDDDNSSTQAFMDRLLPLLPSVTKEQLFGGTARPVNRVVSSVSPRSDPLPAVGYKGESLFDFSKSLYQFYPTDNAEYLEQCEENGAVFLRAKLIHVSSKEYMGVGADITDLSRLNDSEYLTVRLRVISPDDTSAVRLLLVGHDGAREIVFDGSSSVSCGEWVELTFPLSSLTQAELSSATLKLWTRTDSSVGQDIFLDIASISLHKAKKTDVLTTVFAVLIGIAVTAFAVFLLFLLLSRRTKKKRRKQNA